jgi:hypothetical protein
VREGAANKRNVSHVWQRNVVNKTTLAAQQRRIFQPRYALPEDAGHGTRSSSGLLAIQAGFH